MIEVFYAPLEPRLGRIELSGCEARHIAKVLRHRPGDRVSVTDGKGTEYELELDDVAPERVGGRIVGQTSFRREPTRRLVLAQALLKGDKLAAVVEAATELGVAEVIPFKSERVVARTSDVRLTRLQQVAVSALKISARTVLPTIAGLVGLEEVARLASGFDRALVAHELEEVDDIEAVVDRSARSALLVVGPEGGLAEHEVERLRAGGARCFTMGPRRLRAETAAVAAVTLCLQRMGEMARVSASEATNHRSERRC